MNEEKFIKLIRYIGFTLKDSKNFSTINTINDIYQYKNYILEIEKYVLGDTETFLFTLKEYYSENLDYAYVHVFENEEDINYAVTELKMIFKKVIRQKTINKILKDD